MNVQAFMKNRNLFPQDDLLQYLGQWVAFDEFGKSILAAAVTLEQLETTLAEDKIDPQTVHFEYIAGPDDDAFQFSPETKHEVSLPK